MIQRKLLTIIGGEPVAMEHDFSIEEMLDMPVMGEVQMNMANTDCVG